MPHSTPWPVSPRVLRVAVCALLAAGCTPPAPHDSQGPDDPGDSADTGPVEPFYQDIAFVESAIVPSVVTATWRTLEPASCTLTFGVEGGRVLTTVERGEPAAEHEVALVGLPPGSAATLVIGAETAAGSEESEPIPFSTGPLPTGVPTVELTVSSPADAFEGFTLVPIAYSRGDSWITILDADGTVVWAYPARQGAHRARLAPDGLGILYADRDSDPDNPEADMYGAVYSIAWDGTERWRWADIDAHHDFVILGDDRYASFGYSRLRVDVGTPDERTYIGDTIIEFDSAGNSTVVWDVFDHFDPLTLPGNARQAMPGNVWDWSHANYLTWEPDTESYLACLRGLDAILAVDGADGGLLWSLSNTWGDYQSPDSEPILAWPHSVERVDGGLAIFNQTYEWLEGPCSHGAVLALDAEAGTATTTWSYANAECARLNYLGSNHPLPNGSFLVDFSLAGIMDEVTPGGVLAQRFELGLDWSFGYAQRMASLTP
ncbi:MAG: aryl-sulfate sulfotransferase [Pseudomonadota bacterium]